MCVLRTAKSAKSLRSSGTPGAFTRRRRPAGYRTSVASRHRMHDMQKGGVRVMRATAVPIVGGGLSGLAAALTIVRAGGRAHVVERRREIGARFHGDFQGLENWSTDGDVLEELESLGIEPTFEYTPFRECVFFDPDGRDHVCRSLRPLWYLVRRGVDAGTLDQSLKAQAVAAGVDIRFGETMEHLPEGGIIAHGPRRVDAIAVGYTF